MNGCCRAIRAAGGDEREQWTTLKQTVLDEVAVTNDLASEVRLLKARCRAHAC